MIKAVADLLQLYIAFYLIYKVGKFLLVRKKYGKNKHGKSIMGKVVYLISNNIHYRLDNRIKSQIASMKIDQSENVVDLKKYKKA